MPEAVDPQLTTPKNINWKKVSIIVVIIVIATTIFVINIPIDEDGRQDLVYDQMLDTFKFLD